MPERSKCKRCGDPIVWDEYYPYCSHYCEDRGMNPEGDDDEPSYGSRWRDGFRAMRQLPDQGG